MAGTFSNKSEIRSPLSIMTESFASKRLTIPDLAVISLSDSRTHLQKSQIC